MPAHPKASFCVFLRRNPPQTPHARTTTRVWHYTATPPSGTPCEFTGRVREVACCSGKPKCTQDTAKTEVSSRNGTWTQLGALPWGGGHLADWCWCVVCGGWRGVGKSLGSHWGSRGYERRVFASVEPEQERHLDATGGHLVGTSVGRRHLAGWCWCGGCLESRWGLGGGSVGSSRGSERRVFASEVSSRTARGGALGGHFCGEEAPSWLVLVWGGWRGVGKSAGSRWGLSGVQ